MSMSLILVQWARGSSAHACGATCTCVSPILAAFQRVAIRGKHELKSGTKKRLDLRWSADWNAAHALLQSCKSEATGWLRQNSSGPHFEQWQCRYIEGTCQRCKGQRCLDQRGSAQERFLGQDTSQLCRRASKAMLEPLDFGQKMEGFNTCILSTMSEEERLIFPLTPFTMEWLLDCLHERCAHSPYAQFGEYMFSQCQVK